VRPNKAVPVSTVPKMAPCKIAYCPLRSLMGKDEECS
jgi:hypothetical protein